MKLALTRHKRKNAAGEDTSLWFLSRDGYNGSKCLSGNVLFNGPGTVEREVLSVLNFLGLVDYNMITGQFVLAEREVEIEDVWFKDTPTIGKAPK